MNESLINRVARQLRYQLEVKDLEEGFYNPSKSLHSEAPSALSTVWKAPLRFGDNNQRKATILSDE